MGRALRNFLGLSRDSMGISRVIWRIYWVHGLGVRSVIGGYIGFGILGAGSSEKSAGPCKGARGHLTEIAIETT